MQDNKKNEAMVSTLKKKLEWYTWYASEEEYDEKAVESILYLLERWEPLEEDVVPDVDEAWKKFLKKREEKEFLPLEDAEAEGKPVCGAGSVSDADEGVAEAFALSGDVMLSGGQAAEMQSKIVKWDASKKIEDPNVRKMGVGRDVAEMQRDEAEDGVVQIMNAIGNLSEEEPDELEASAAPGKTGKRKKVRSFRFVERHKIIVAAVLVLMILVVGNTIHAVANPEAGFFFWMKRDDSGVKMITSPEGLNDTTGKRAKLYYSEDDLPQWAGEWIKLVNEDEILDGYAQQYYETSELDSRQHIAGHYLNCDTKQEVVLGVWIYLDKISYNIEEFIGYTYIQSYEIDQKQMDIYSRTENEDDIYYIVCFYDKNCQYYVRGWDNLDELKFMIEKYWDCIKGNL